MTASDTSRELTAADVLAEPAPTDAPRAPRATDVLIRQLLATRATLDACALQLDAAFEVVNRIRDAEQLREAAASIEQQEPERRPPPTFGTKRRGATDATVGASPVAPVAPVAPSPVPGS